VVKQYELLLHVVKNHLAKYTSSGAKTTWSPS